jgi:tRNA pseudouridine55 synthase
MIIPVYKPLGASSHQLAARIGAERGEKATHTGTLDPMAEGVLVVLTGEDRFRKQELSATKKEYHFQIVFGISTDSHDLLGVPTTVTTSIPQKKVLEKKLTSILSQMLGETTQRQPIFSAGREGGKSYFELGKQQRVPKKIKENDITLYSLDCKKMVEVQKETIMRYHKKALSTVSGDFRQEEIREAWESHSDALPKQLLLAECTATVSKRTYIRGIVRDISQALQLPATTYSIIRTKNGQFSLDDCQNNTK